MGVCGTILSGIGGLYKVKTKTDDNIVFCRARGSFRHEGITPLPGDNVMLSSVEEEYVIDEIFERSSCLIRPALANLTHIFAVVPAAKPKPDLYTVDKIISASQDKGIEPVVIITKSDLNLEFATELKSIYETGGYTAIITDKNGVGDAGIFDYIKNSDNMVAAFAGVSGAGKSTLLTRLFPDLDLKTGDISKISRGKHTTRHAELYPVLSGLLIADTPGFSMMDFSNFDFIKEENVIYSFRELENLSAKCRYTDCTHTKEDGCSVLNALENGIIAKSRYESFIRMKKEVHKEDY